MSEAQYTLLVVDDDLGSRDSLARRLERRGYRVLTAEDGSRALEVLATAPVDLVLLDVMMPGLSGLDVLRSVRALRSPLELPVIMTTARSASEDVVDALEAGANDYVVKPIDFAVTLARVQAQLRTREAARHAAPTLEITAPAAVATGEGAVLDDRYRLEERIGAGGYGTVYRATHLELHHAVAVKVLDARVATSPEALRRFRQEGISACRIKHPNAVAVMDFGVTEQGVAFLVMELLEGHPLDEELVARGRLPVARCVEVVTPVCSALAAAHARGIIHRDVKPSNVFASLTPQGEVIKLLDFGVAKLRDAAAEERLTLEGIVMGTPAYLAPERLLGEPYDGRSDVYAVGVMLYRMLSGQSPYGDHRDQVTLMRLKLDADPPPLSAVWPEAPPGVERVVMRALRRDPAQRPTAAELGSQLAQAARSA